MARARAMPTIQIDNEKIIVTRWDFAPGAETGRHTHEMDYVVVPLTQGALTIENPDGTTAQSSLTVGGSYARPAGVDHNVINDNPTPFSFIEIELKLPLSN